MFGFTSSINKWKTEWLNSVKNSIDYSFSETFITDGNELNENSLKTLQMNLPQYIIMVIFDSDKKILYTLKKTGRQRRDGKERSNEQVLKYTNLYPVKINDTIKYYYSFAYPDNKESPTNQNLINSIKLTLAVSIFVSLIMAVFFAFFFSKKISNESKILSLAIDQIARGNLNINIGEKGSTEINTIAESVNILKEKLKNEKQLRDQWSEDVAHDLRTPIAALKAQLEGMGDGVLDISRERILKNLGELNKIENLVKNLTDLIKLESPEIQIKKEKIDADIFFRDIINSFQKKIDDKKIDYTYKNSVDFFYGDEDLLTRAFSNMINNALIYSNKKGSITVTIYRDKNIFFEIYNSGSYISEEESQKIFDRLYRGESSRTTNGSGLGLTIAKKIIELHGGEISVKSVIKKGTNFIVKL